MLGLGVEYSRDTILVRNLQTGTFRHAVVWHLAPNRDTGDIFTRSNPGVTCRRHVPRYARITGFTSISDNLEAIPVRLEGGALKSDNRDDDSRQGGYLNELERKESEKIKSGFGSNVGGLDGGLELYETYGQS